MPNLVGVISFTHLFNPQSIKRQALIFDQLAIPGCHVLEKAELLREMARDYEWLLDQGIIVDPGKPDRDLWWTVLSRYANDPVMRQLVQLEHGVKDTSEMAEVLAALGIAPETEAFRMYETFLELHWHSEFTLRPISTLLREQENMDAYPVFLVRPAYLNNAPAGKDDVVEIVLNALPVPDDSVSWEQVLIPQRS